MNPRYLLFFCLVLLGATGAQSQSGPNVHLTGTSSPHKPLPASTPVLHDLSHVPLTFESNQGQTNSRVRFLSHTGDSTLFLTPSEAVFSMTTESGSSHLHQGKGRKASRFAHKISRLALRMQVVGADPKAAALEQPPQVARINYFQGKDPGKWHSGVPTYGRVGFQGVYPGVDLVYYGNQRHLEYDFVVAPHADPKRITLRFAGAQQVRVNANGDLIVRTYGRGLTWQKPTAYQQDKAGKHAVAAHFCLKTLPDGQKGVSFALGRYDTARSLVIDPVLRYSTYLGGNSGPAGADSAVGFAVDSNGSAYITGIAGSLDFPITAGTYQTVNTDHYSIFVTKLNTTGTALVYSTFLGGNDSDNATAIAVDSGGNAYVTGSTKSRDFPTTPGAFQPTKTVSNDTESAFVTKLNPTGTALVYSTYLQGNDKDKLTRSDSIAVDGSGNAYVTGQTTSAAFPVTAGAFQTSFKVTSSTSPFVTKLNTTGTALAYSTFLGSSGAAGFLNCIAVDSVGSAYVAGSTIARDFPVTPNAFQSTNPNHDAPLYSTGFVTKLNPTGSALLYSTYLGGSTTGYFGGGDSIYGLAVDTDGNAYVSGTTNSGDFPVTPGAFQPTYLGQQGFVTKLNPTGTALVYSTYFDGAIYVAVDSGGNAYITGSATTSYFPTTIGAFQRMPAFFNESACFLSKLNPAGSRLLYSTLLNGSKQEGGAGVAVDSVGGIYVLGGTLSSDYPTTPGAFQRTNPALGSNAPSAFVTKMSAIPIFPDFNRDNYSDLILQNPSTGAIASWFMQAVVKFGDASFSQSPPTDYALVGVGDFNGHGGLTLVLQSSITNRIAFWYGSGTNSTDILNGDFVDRVPDAGWKVVGVGDFNGDGKSDLVFQNQTTNRVAFWLMDGPHYQGGMVSPHTPLGGWQMVGVGDFNGDSFQDLVFQDRATGHIAVWYLQGTTYTGGTVLPSHPAAGWKVVSVGDFNADGSADIVFQTPFSGQAVVWYVKGGVFSGGETLSQTVPTGWKIVGPR